MGGSGMAGDCSDQESPKQPRRSRAGTRSVRMLDPEQLERKRAIDRASHKISRQRTKDHIGRLEQRVADLSKGNMCEELLQRNRLLEDEIIQLRNHLGLLKVTQSEAPGVNDDYKEYSAATASMSIPVDEASCNVRIKGEEYSVNGHEISRFGKPSFVSIRACEALQDKAGTYEPLHQTHSPLDIEDSRLQTTYSGDTASNMVLSGMSPQTYFQAQSLQYPWSATERDQPGTVYASAGAQTDCPSRQVDYAFPVHRYSSDSSNAIDAATADGITVLPRHVDPGIQPSSYVWDLPLKLMAPTCILDSILLTTIHQQRTLALSGASQLEVSGPPTFNMLSLFDPRKGPLSHPVSRAWTDYAINMTYISSKPLADILACLLVAYRLQRWRIAPNMNNIKALPDWLVPRGASLEICHPLWMDHAPWPDFRDHIIQNQSRYLTDDFHKLLGGTLGVQWPYRPEAAIAMQGNEMSIHPLFENHVRTMENWSLGPQVALQFPELSKWCRSTP